MYLKWEELTQLLTRLSGHFDSAVLLMDCYTEFAAKASKYKNPINDVGVTEVYGLDDPKLLEDSGLKFLQEPMRSPAPYVPQRYKSLKHPFPPELSSATFFWKNH